MLSNSHYIDKDPTLILTARNGCIVDQQVADNRVLSEKSFLMFFTLPIVLDGITIGDLGMV
jgi:hypothetical protein